MDPYIQYMYSYPHKTAYGPLTGISLKDCGAQLAGTGHSLYLHIPFCQTKCGYCDLFSVTGQTSQKIDRYLDAVERQIQQYAAALAPFKTCFSDLTIGGGTPLLLSEAQLRRVFSMIFAHLPFDEDRTIVIETAPAQTTAGKLKILKEAGVTRVSMGVQSFFDAELKTLKRQHLADCARRALELLMTFSFPCVNIDLIYGIGGQTVDTFLASVKEAAAYGVEEIFLYPLYIKHGAKLERQLAGRVRPAGERLTDGPQPEEGRSTGSPQPGEQGSAGGLQPGEWRSADDLQPREWRSADDLQPGERRSASTPVVNDLRQRKGKGPGEGLGEGEGLWLDPERALAEYREAAAFLQTEGFRQDSMRRFVRVPMSARLSENDLALMDRADGGEGRCAPRWLKNGMGKGKRAFTECGFGTSLALGCGGRSYLGRLHFCTPYAITRQSCLAQLQKFEETEDYLQIRHGIWLSEEEEKRRYVIRHLLIRPGLPMERYQAHFGTEAMEDFPLLKGWIQEGYLAFHRMGPDGCGYAGGECYEGDAGESREAVSSVGGKEMGETFLALTEEGLALSDYLGPQLISPAIRRRMEAWEAEKRNGPKSPALW